MIFSENCRTNNAECVENVVLMLVGDRAVAFTHA